MPRSFKITFAVTVQPYACRTCHICQDSLPGGNPDAICGRCIAAALAAQAAANNNRDTVERTTSLIFLRPANDTIAAGPVSMAMALPVAPLAEAEPVAVAVDSPAIPLGGYGLLLDAEAANTASDEAVIMMLDDGAAAIAAAQLGRATAAVDNLKEDFAALRLVVCRSSS